MVRGSMVEGCERCGGLAVKGIRLRNAAHHDCPQKNYMTLNWSKKGESNGKRDRERGQKQKTIILCHVTYRCSSPRPTVPYREL